MRVNVLNDALADAKTSVIIVIVSGIGVETLIDVGVNVLAAAMIALEFIMPGSLEESALCCRAAFNCWAMAVLDCAHVLQAWMPPCHVCFNFVFPVPPHSLNQEPP